MARAAAFRNASRNLVLSTPKIFQSAITFCHVIRFSNSIYIIYGKLSALNGSGVRIFFSFQNRNENEENHVFTNFSGSERNQAKLVQGHSYVMFITIIKCLFLEITLK